MYENSNGKRIACLISQNSKYRDASFQFKNTAEIKSFYWMDSSIAFSVTGDIDRNALFEIAKIVYQQISGVSDSTNQAALPEPGIINSAS